MATKEVRQKVAVVVSCETGEIINDIYEKDKIVPYKEDEKKVEYMNSHEMNFNKGVSFIKLYDKSITTLRKNLTPTEFTFAISLTELVSYEDCILRTNGHGNGKVLDMKDLSEILDINYSVVRRVVSSLKKKGVIGCHDTGSISKDIDTKLNKVYTANPYIYFRGVNVNKTVSNFYKNSGWNSIAE